MELRDINKIIKDLDDVRWDNKKYKRIYEKVIKKITDEEEGENGLSFETYEILNHEGYFITLRITTDSYGSNEQVAGAQIGKEIKKEVTIFEKTK